MVVGSMAAAFMEDSGADFAVGSFLAAPSFMTPSGVPIIPGTTLIIILPILTIIRLIPTTLTDPLHHLNRVRTIAAIRKAIIPTCQLVIAGGYSCRKNRNNQRRNSIFAS